MRSLKIDRKPRADLRKATGRATPRRERAPAPRGKREEKETGWAARLLAAMFAPLARAITKPMLLVTLFTLLFALVAALMASGTVGRSLNAVRGASESVVTHSGFGISEIHLAGNGRVPPATILAALGLQPGQSIFDADLAAARSRILALDWIASADVVRRYPDAIFVTVMEKRPFALWYSPKGAAVVERAGGIITSRDTEKFSRLPKLAGPGAPAAAAELVEGVMAHRALLARVALYQRQSERRWNLILNDGVVVKLPETNWQAQLDALEHLVIDTGILERNVTEIDLRSPTHYFFVLKSGEKKDVQRGKET